MKRGKLRIRSLDELPPQKRPARVLADVKQAVASLAVTDGALAVEALQEIGAWSSAALVALRDLLVKQGGAR